jgi:hypothetical protein
MISARDNSSRGEDRDIPACQHCPTTFDQIADKPSVAGGSAIRLVGMMAETLEKLEVSTQDEL